MMNRLSRVLLLLTVALGVLAPVIAAPAQADPSGGVIVIPGSGTDLDPIRLRTSTGCPPQADGYYARMHGHGFLPGGQVITANTRAGLSQSVGFDVYVALVMADYAKENRTTLTGRYDITVSCINRLTLESYLEFTGSLEFTSPTTYQAIGSAKPIGSPPPPRMMNDDVSALLQDPGSPSSDPPLGSGQPASPPAEQAPIGEAPGADPRVPSPDRQVASASQRHDGTEQGILWLILVLVGAVLVALVLAVVVRQIRKRHSS